MVIYPAIDILNGKCVRLMQGDYGRSETYSEDPLQVAHRWQNEGARVLHVVDLDGARDGTFANAGVISSIIQETALKVQVGGGIRTLESVERWIEAGVARVIIGTAALRNPQLVAEAAGRFGERVVVGIDAKDGFVAVEGWTQVSPKKALDFAREMEHAGVASIIYTDISRDGMLSGVNLGAMEEMVRAVRVPIIASGGVGSLEDLRALSATGVAGVIVGKALYTGAVALKDALALGERGSDAC